MLRQPWLGPLLGLSEVDRLFLKSNDLPSFLWSLPSLCDNLLNVARNNHFSCTHGDNGNIAWMLETSLNQGMLLEISLRHVGAKREVA